MSDVERFLLECELRLFLSMQSLGHWTIGNQRDFTDEEKVWIKKSISDLEAKLNSD